MEQSGTMDLWRLGVALVVIGMVAIAYWLRRQRRPTSIVKRERVQRRSVKPPTSRDKAAIAELRHNLRLKTLHDESMIDRLVELERQRRPGASEVEWYQAAVERWERDNR